MIETNCTDIKGCESGKHSCHTIANCTNTDGSYTCACIEGYSGDGTNCTDINECDSSPPPCHANARLAKLIFATVSLSGDF